MPKVLFLPDNVEIEVDEGENLFRTALGGHVHLYAACGGAGTCGKCRVRIEEGSVAGGRSSKLSAADLEEGFVLACLSKVVEDIVVTIPEETSLTHIKPPEGKRVEVLNSKVLKGSAFEDRLPAYGGPSAISKVFLELPPPTLEEPTADKERLERGLREADFGDVNIPLSVIRESVQLLRDSEWKVTATLLKTATDEGMASVEPRLICLESGDTRDTLLGVALDVGTTTCAAELVDLNSRQVLARASAYNSQIAFGDDVITRIVHIHVGVSINCEHGCVSCSKKVSD